MVYILGAGFSVPGGAPVQAKILKEVFSLEPIQEFLDFQGVQDKTDRLLYGSAAYFLESKKVLARYIVDQFIPELEAPRNLNETDKEFEDNLTDAELERAWQDLFLNLINNYADISLEDIFTSIDKALLNKENLQRYSYQNLTDVRRALNCCIIYLMAYRLTKNPNLGLYDEIASFLVKQRLEAGLEGDPFSIITLNWEVLLDTALYRAAEKASKSLVPNGKSLHVDYCVYDYSIDGDDEIPSTHIRPRGLFNIKILKLHGSMNWLFCMNCGRLFKTFNDYIALGEFSERKITCRYCKENYNFGEAEKYFGGTSYPFLESLLITPTFVKDLNNTNLKNVWRNAFIELSEANEIVFIGYSFPQADFELRYLFKKSVKPNTKITVVLHETDNPKYFKQHERVQLPVELIRASESIVGWLPESRYSSFFGKNRIDFHYGGVEKYFKEIIDKHQ